MNNNEKLGLIERVNHASEDQAKRTLRSMILKCNIRQGTIARAIKDAIERHTPTPIIIYQQQESQDDREIVLNSSHKKSKKKKKDQDGRNQAEENMPSTASKKCHNTRQGTRRGDINADPLVGQLILKKTKTKGKRKKKHSSDHDGDQSRPDSSEKDKPKNASKLAEAERRTWNNLTGGPFTRKIPSVINLVSSSADDDSDSDPSENEILDDKVPGDDSSDFNSSDDYSTEDDSPEDESSGDERREDSLPEGMGRSQDGSNNEANQATERNGDGGRGAARSSTASKDKTLGQNESIKASPFHWGKKRKAPERTVEEADNGHSSKPATDVHLNKRPKQDLPQKLQRSPEERKCRKCDLLFPSVAQLLKHRTYCKGSAAPSGGLRRSEPPSIGHGHQIQQAQKASHPAGDSFTVEPRNILRLPSRPHQRTLADRGMSVPPPSFVHEPNNFPRGPTPAPIALARSLVESPPRGFVHRPVPFPSSPSDASPGQQAGPPKPESLRLHLLQQVQGKAVHRCKNCNKHFRHCENWERACSRHCGMCRSPF